MAKKLATFFSTYKTVFYRRDRILLRPGERVTGLHYLVTGIVRHYRVLPNGEEVTVHFYRPGSVFPLMLVLAQVDNRFYFETITPVELKTAPVARVLRFVKENPELGWEFLGRFARAIDGLAFRLEQTLSQKTSGRVAHLLLYLAQRFGTEVKGKGVVIGLKLTHRDIASFIGASRETVSRELSRLKALGLITDQTTITNMNGLKGRSKLA